MSGGFWDEVCAEPHYVFGTAPNVFYNAPGCNPASARWPWPSALENLYTAALLRAAFADMEFCTWPSMKPSSPKAPSITGCRP